MSRSYDKTTNTVKCETPLYIKYRKLWWVSLGCAVAFTLVAWMSVVVFGLSQEIQLVLLALAYISLAFGLYFNIGKARGERLRYEAAIKNPKSREYKEARARKREAN